MFVYRPDQKMRPPRRRKMRDLAALLIFIATVPQSQETTPVVAEKLSAKSTAATHRGLLRESMKNLEITKEETDWLTTRRYRNLFGGGDYETNVPTSAPTTSSGPTGPPVPGPTSGPSAVTNDPTVGPTPGPTLTEWIPGVFGTTLWDNQNNKVEVNIGLNGRALAYSNQAVVLDDGTNVGGTLYHRLADGGAIFAKENGMGYYYLSNSENGFYPNNYDPNKPREFYANYLTGGVFRLEFNDAHEFIGYTKLLGLTADNCAAGRTPYNTYISCEEEEQWGQCWQVDPEGEIPPEATDMTGNYGTPNYGNWEAAIFYDGFGYTTDDDRTMTGGDGPGFTWNGAVVRYKPDATAVECLNGDTKAERWCALNSAETHQYLKLTPGQAGQESGTFEWVTDIDDANPELYEGSEGLDAKDGILIFCAKFDRHIFFLDLAAETYQRRNTPFSAEQPDNLVILGDGLWLCQDGGNRAGVWVRDFDPDGTNAAQVLYGNDYEVETAGIAFSPDEKMMYVSFQDKATWQFWRLDGQSFADLPATYQPQESLRYWLHNRVYDESTNESREQAFEERMYTHTNATSA